MILIGKKAFVDQLVHKALPRLPITLHTVFSTIMVLLYIPFSSILLCPFSEIDWVSTNIFCNDTTSLYQMRFGTLPTYNQYQEFIPPNFLILQRFRLFQCLPFAKNSEKFAKRFEKRAKKS